MSDIGEPVVSLRGVIKDYRGLRPLRIRELALRAGESVALLGLDEAMAGVLMDMLTAGSLPDSGEVLVFGRPTASVESREQWLQLLDRFGLVSDRSVLLDQLTVEQNLAIPLSLEVQRMSEALRSSVHRLADEVRIPTAELTQPLGRLPPSGQLRVRLGRALALDPHVLLAEHPTARLTVAETQMFAEDLNGIVRGRGLAMLICTADAKFGKAVAGHVLTLQPATGELKPAGFWPWRR